MLQGTWPIMVLSPEISFMTAMTSGSLTEIYSAENFGLGLFFQKISFWMKQFFPEKWSSPENFVPAYAFA